MDGEKNATPGARDAPKRPTAFRPIRLQPFGTDYETFVRTARAATGQDPNAPLTKTGPSELFLRLMNLETRDAEETTGEGSLPMSLRDYLHAKSLIEEAGGDFEGPKSEALVAAAELALGLRFPPSYRRFLLELGCGDLNGLEIYGVINEEFEDSAVPNGIWLTLDERRSIGLDHAHVLVGSGGDGTHYAIDTRSIDASAESPVVRLTPNGVVAESVASSFGPIFCRLFSPSYKSLRCDAQDSPP